MESIQGAMTEGFNEFILKHREVPSTRISLIQFDTTNPEEVVYSAIPISEAPKLNLVPRGGTPLLDALCRTIDSTGRRLAAMPNKDRPRNVLFVIITDGEENSSRSFKREDVHSRVSKQTNDYNWEFIYIGANQDAFAEAASFGISSNRAMNYVANAYDTRDKFRSLTSNTVAYANAGVTGQSVSSSLDWDDEQRKESTTDGK